MFVLQAHLMSDLVIVLYQVKLRLHCRVAGRGKASLAGTTQPTVTATAAATASADHRSALSTTKPSREQDHLCHKTGRLAAPAAFLLLLSCSMPSADLDIGPHDNTSRPAQNTAMAVSFTLYAAATAECPIAHRKGNMQPPPAGTAAMLQTYSLKRSICQLARDVGAASKVLTTTSFDEQHQPMPF